MSFLNAAILSALVPLLGMPLVIHWLNKRFPRLFFFSSVKQIKETLARRSRLFRWRHWLLLLLRTAFLLLVLLAFLKPFLDRFGSIHRAASDRHVLLVVDHSLSMEFQGEAGSSRGRVLHEASQLIDTLRPNDYVNVILADQPVASCFVDFSRDHAEAQRFLRQLKAGWARADFNQANALAAQLLAKQNEPSEIYFFSDFQRKSWANVQFSALPAAARLFFIDVSAVSKNNHAIQGVTLSPAQAIAGDAVSIEVIVGNFSDQPYADRLKLWLDQRPGGDKEFSVPPWSTAKVNLPLRIGAPGLHRCELNLTPDALAADDRYFLTIPVLEQEEVLIVSDDPHPEKDAVYFLKTALNPYGDKRGSLLPRSLRSTELSAGQLASAKKVFMTRVAKLSDATASLLAKFLFQGGGVVYFLDGPSDAANLGALEAVMGPGSMPMKLAGRRAVENVGAGAQQVIKGNFKSKFLQLFQGATRQDLALLEFYDFYQAGATGAGSILLSYADDSPAMAALDHGLGCLVLLNFSAGEQSSNLARQRIFPAWMQELARHLHSGESAPAAYVLGETIQTEVWNRELKQEAFVGPNGEPIDIHRELMGERCGVAFVPAAPGFFSLGKGTGSYCFAVNPSPAESDLRVVDKTLLPAQMPAGQQSHFIEGQEAYESLITGRPAFHWLVLAALVLLVAELGLQMMIKRASLC